MPDSLGLCMTLACHPTHRPLGHRGTWCRRSLRIHQHLWRKRWHWQRRGAWSLRWERRKLVLILSYLSIASAQPVYLNKCRRRLTLRVDVHLHRHNFCIEYIKHICYWECSKSDIRSNLGASIITNYNQYFRTHNDVDGWLLIFLDGLQYSRHEPDDKFSYLGEFPSWKRMHPHA